MLQSKTFDCGIENEQSKRRICSGHRILVHDYFSYHPCAHGSLEKMRRACSVRGSSVIEIAIEGVDLKVSVFYKLFTCMYCRKTKERKENESKTKRIN
ncbi:hypothetical protein POJ06DRAFT_257020 [Lipomyces tetrasporus]|uniref:Uncharacterized protein n=1 Tax=Lipomyces tetrasporus TaxID=54092 RepID=A0AAD7VS99_9ASCO|nr:uncharacterized protein POJ06DRAFT_257020 [Lipomyces tetrasporus]KAJ8099459.1 hypothetical protein POJ06DRAFT_257020 [Lipomyces tetrasporus]